MAAAKRRRRETANSRRISRLESKRVYRYALTLALGALLFSPLAMVTWPMPDIDLLLRENPRSTDLILKRAEEADGNARSVERMQTWVPFGEISSHLQRAVVLCEDSAFFESDRSALPWRRSPITRKLAETLYFSGDGNLIRNAAETITVYRMERALPRERILEIYLNVIEWGEGVYGAGAAAEHYFGKDAARLNRREAALLACAIPSPLESDPSSPDGALGARAERVALVLNKKGAPDRTGAPR